MRAKAGGHTVFTVPNQAMSPALRIRAVVPLDLEAYKRAPIARGDVVAFRSEKYDGLFFRVARWVYRAQPSNCVEPS